jgi:REP element-mobilizing transposase RayT/DNA-binding CsgD family transcriptional regulator
MSRAWRIEYEGALYHLLSRGNQGNDIFEDNQDRNIFLNTVEEMSERFEVEIFAYVLMSNHYHLLVRTQHANIKKAMHWFGTTYTSRFNTRHERSGHLFQGRYKSIVVQNDAYLLRLSCYIHRNPLRAGVVERLADYRWSSYLTYAYDRKSPEWLSTDVILSQFEGHERHRRYREMVQKYAKEEKRLLEDLRHGLFWGSHQFVERLRKEQLPSKLDSSLPQQTQLAKASDPFDILKSAQRLLKCDVERFVRKERVKGTDKDKRDLLIYLLWKSGELSNSQIGQLFGISYSAVSHAVKSLKSKMQHDGNIRAKFKQLNSQFKL